MNNDLYNFLIEAKKQTYANENAKKQSLQGKAHMTTSIVMEK